MCTGSGFEVSLQWQNGKLTMGTILSKIGGRCRVRYGDQELVLNTVKGRLLYSLTKLVGVR
ncbi:glycoside hydrolase family 95-like protein [Spirosoma koreense]